MKSLNEYIAESESWLLTPADGDVFAFEFEDDTLIETYIIEVADDCVLLDATPEIMDVISEWANLEDTDEGDSNVILETMSYQELDEDQGAGQVAAKAVAAAPVNTMGDIDEAEYHGKHVSLNKPTRGDVKKFKVYVKDPKTGNVKKVNFGHGGKTAQRLGQKTMRIKKSNPARRRSFRARHHCENPGPKTKARYWSCRAW
jgi:hypothetical protein